MNHNFNPRSYKRSDKKLFDGVGGFFISIHAPTRGATEGDWSSDKDTHDFNPRSYKRSDRWYLASWFDKPISIHAPTRGATSRSALSAWLYIHFNPRSYKRSDSYERCYRCHLGNFNPRSYKRSDVEMKFRELRANISIHAPTRGATCIL